MIISTNYISHCKTSDLMIEENKFRFPSFLINKLKHDKRNIKINGFKIMLRTRTDALVNFSQFLEESKWRGFTNT